MNTRLDIAECTGSDTEEEINCQFGFFIGLVIDLSEFGDLTELGYYRVYCSVQKLEGIKGRQGSELELAGVIVYTDVWSRRYNVI